MGSVARVDGQTLHFTTQRMRSMNIYRQAGLVCVFGLLATLLISTAWAGEKTVETTIVPKYSWESDASLYCKRYVKIEKNELNQMIRDMKETGYPVDDYFLTAACDPEYAGGVKVPMIQLTAEAPCTRVEYPQIIHKYYIVKRKEPKIWLEVINTKNTEGDTYLDYIEVLRDKNLYNTPEGQECMNNLISFACKTGGVYSKYPAKTCPAE
jgi:hypothetical protein